MAENLLLIECVDEPGLISKATNLLFENNCNIDVNDVFVDEERNKFLMRTEFHGELDHEVVIKSINKLLPENSNAYFVANKRKKLLIMATRESHCLGDLLLRAKYQDLAADVLGVISNREDLTDLVESFSYPFHFVPNDKLSREEHEAKLIKLIEQYQPDYIVLAKYMRILTEDFVRRYSQKIINIHHSFLPAFIGANPYKKAYERGVKIIGATAHFVTEDLDEGPIITQNVIAVDHTHTLENMRSSGRDVEKITLARAIELVIEDRVFISGNKTIIFD